MTESLADIIIWGITGVLTAIFIGCLVWGFRLPKKGRGWGKII